MQCLILIILYKIHVFFNNAVPGPPQNVQVDITDDSVIIITYEDPLVNPQCAVK